MRKTPRLTTSLLIALLALAIGCASTKDSAPAPSGAVKPAPAVAATPQAAPAAAPMAGVQSYEAESPDNERGPSVTTEDPDVGGKCSGGKYVGYLGNSPEAILRFKKINVPRAGAYTLTIYYMTGEDRQAYVAVNGSEQKMTDFTSTGDFSSASMGTVELKIELKAGDNTIEMGNPDAYGPDIDRITIKAAN